MFGKRGQFFLLAALVISTILIGLATLYTQVNAPKEDTAVYDLSSELNYESLQVIDNGVYTDLSQDEIYGNIVNLTNYYFEKDSSSDLVIVYGNSSQIHVLLFTAKESGSVGVSTGGRSVTNRVYNLDVEENEGEVLGSAVSFHFGGQIYSVNISQGQTFSTIFKKVRGNQTYVAVGQD